MQYPNDPYVLFIEKTKHIGQDSLWTAMMRDFRGVYSGDGELNLYRHMIKAGIAIDETKAFFNRKLISYMYSKDILSSTGGNVGHAIRYSKLGGASAKISDNERYLTKLTKCSHSQLLRELKNSTSLIAHRNTKINPYELIVDLDVLAGISNLKTIRQVHVSWIEALLGNEA
jgi:hypothetical protein